MGAGGLRLTSGGCSPEGLPRRRLWSAGQCTAQGHCGGGLTGGHGGQESGLGRSGGQEQHRGHDRRDEERRSDGPVRAGGAGIGGRGGCQEGEAGVDSGHGLTEMHALVLHAAGHAIWRLSVCLPVCLPP